MVVFFLRRRPGAVHPPWAARRRSTTTYIWRLVAGAPRGAAHGVRVALQQADGFRVRRDDLVGSHIHGVCGAADLRRGAALHGSGGGGGAGAVGGGRPPRDVSGFSSRAGTSRHGRRRRREPRPLKPVLSWRRCAGCKPRRGPKADTPGGTTRTLRLELGVFVEVTRTKTAHPIPC